MPATTMGKGDRIGWARLCFLFVAPWLVSCAVSPMGQQTIAIDSELTRGDQTPFLSHKGTQRFSTYLAMNLPYAPTNPIRDQVEKRFKVRLKDRGEAHITVLTPPEYQQLSDKLDMAQIEALVGNDVQKAAFQIICLGRAAASSPRGELSTFFLVVVSEDLVELRRRIANAYMARGGAVGRFDPLAYQPHITIGFTERDLHEADGANKDEDSCVAPGVVGKT